MTKLPPKTRSLPDCANGTSNSTIAQSHKVPATTYSATKDAFYGTNNVPTVKITLATDTRIDSHKDCQLWGIKVSFNPNITDSNDDITISMARLNDLNAPHNDYFVIYSLHLYFGLLNGLGMQQLELCKGKYDAGDGVAGYTILLSGKDRNNNDYNGDIATMHPFQDH